MLINLRNALMAGRRLPYDAEVEYLESSGTQYIDTNTIDDPVNNIAQITFSIPTSTGATMNLFGSSGSRFNYVSARWGSNRYNLGPSASTTPVLPISVGDIHVGTYTLINNKLTYTLDGESAVYSSSLVYDDLPLAIFCIYGRPNTAPFVGRVYSFKVIRKSDGTVIADYIPVRKGTVGYLYDRVSGKLFGNAGTGDFVVGQDVVPVEYIESHGTEYIDTGYIPNQQTRWELDYQFSTIGSGSNGMFQLNPTVRFNIGQGTDRFFNISYGANNALNIASDTLRHLFVADIPNLQWRLDSSSGAFPAPVSTALQYSLRIFCRNSQGGTVYNLHSGRCFASRMYQSGILSQRLLPVRVGTEGAMMDVLTRRIYRNAGTGAFTYGNDLKYPIPAE